MLGQRCNADGKERKGVGGVVCHCQGQNGELLLDGTANHDGPPQKGRGRQSPPPVVRGGAVAQGSAGAGASPRVQEPSLRASPALGEPCHRAGCRGAGILPRAREPRHRAGPPGSSTGSDRWPVCARKAWGDA
jgi:hypothetical protein